MKNATQRFQRPALHEIKLDLSWLCVIKNKTAVNKLYVEISKTFYV